MNIVFISTDADEWALGLRSLSAVCKVAGHTTHLVFLSSSAARYSPTVLDELTELAREADVVGVSCLAISSDKAKQVIDHLHRQHKLVLWGGVHATLNPEACADWADIVCQGEGEGMILDVLERLEAGRDWKDIPNLVCKVDGVLINNPARPPIPDLDALPLPDFSFESEYHLMSDGLQKVSTLPRLKNSGRIIFNGSRGCAFHCTYCCNSKLKSIYPVKERYVRRMSVPRFIELAQTMKQIFPQGKFFYFIDEDFGARPLDELKQLAEEYPRKVGLPFACLSHPARVNPQMMEYLVKAGMFQIHIGIESGSERTRRQIFDRHVSNEVIKRCAEVVSHYPQVAPFYFIIFGNPYEEREDLEESIRLIASLPPGFLLQAYSLVFFPGSGLYERALVDGLISGEADSGYDMDFLSGLKYQEHSWKRKNLYLNGLISLMDGSCSQNLLGFLPRGMIRLLLNPRVIAFNNRHPSFIQALISLKVFYIRSRKTAVHLLRRLTNNPIVRGRRVQRCPA